MALGGGDNGGINAMPTWISAHPSKRAGTRLDRHEFIDAITIRYDWPVVEPPDKCPGCHEDFDLRHALKCKTGGAPSRRHDEVRDTIGAICHRAGLDTTREPVITTDSTDPITGGKIKGLRADLLVKGLDTTEGTAAIDFSIHDASPASYVNKSPAKIIAARERAKRRKYGVAVAQKGWTFKPFTLLAEEGAYGGGADDVITKLAKRIADKEQNEQARVESTIRRRIAFAVIRGTSRCIRSKRVVWNKVGLCVYDG